MQIYHPGKVVEVFSNSDKNVVSADAEIQATLEMWDENVLTFAVDPKISKQIKKDDIVLVDYRPTSAKNPMPRNLIMKIIKGDKAERVWKVYKRHFEKRSKQLPATQPLPPQLGYVG